jgi:membrane-bound serine protease (ClpP class)
MAALAEKNGYSKSVALAMVDFDVELVEVEVDDTVRAVSREEYEILLREAEERGEGLERGRTISPAGKLLTLTAGEMERYGLSSATVSGLPEVLDALGIGEAEVIRVEQTVPDKVVAVLTSAGLTSLLVLAGIVALFMELTSPGFGLPGTTAIICFAAVFASNFLLGTVGSLELLLFLGGVVLLALEIFLIPGFGVTGISGILLIVVSLVLSRQTFILPAVDWQWDIFRDNLLIILASLTASFLLLFLLARYLPRFVPFRRGMVLTSAQRVEEGYTVQVGTDRGRLLGRSGRTLTVLRPVGKAEIDDQILTVESEGEYIPAGATVEVVEVDSNRIVVRSG